MSPIKVAVLDDYAESSREPFTTLDPAQYEVSVFKDTLLPYNHPSTPQTEKDKLASRLEPFNVICV